MEQSNSGLGAVAVQIDGNANTVTITAGTSQLTLDLRHRLRSAPVEHRDLLLTDLRASTLVGRTEELDQLRTWLVAPEPISVLCLTGRAGAGKTRLAIELCERAEAEDWLCGFAPSAELVRFHRQQNLSGWHWPKPTLVVVDYAAASSTILRTWLEALAHRVPKPDTPSLRLLLLERHADPATGWWADLIRPGGLSGRGPDALVHPKPLALPSLASLEDRRALLTEVMRLAAELEGITVPAPPQPGTDPDFDRRLGRDAHGIEPLYLVMAGLVAVTTGAPTALSFSRTDLAERIAQSERARLDRLAKGWNLEPHLVGHLAACVTLQGGCNLDDATRLVEEECGTMDYRIDRPAEQLVARLADALTSSTGIDVDAIRPDLIGEAFLLQEIIGRRRAAGKSLAIVGRAWHRAGAPVAVSLIRTAQDLAGGDRHHVSLTWLGHLVSLTSDPMVLRSLADALPDQTLALRELAAEIEQRIAGQLPDGPGKAQALNNLASRLRELGRREDALAAAEEAVALRRTLAAQRPDAFNPDLAGSLNNLATCLSELGWREDALAVAQQAADLYRTLAAQRPDAFNPNLAMALNNLANCLSELGRREDALAAAQEAVALRRTLAAQRPDGFNPDLAMALSNLATFLSELGRREDALAAAQRAADLYRTLAAQRPDAFNPNLAMALNNLANCLSELGRREDALAAAQEAVALCRTLAAQRPDAFNPDLAGSLNNLATFLSDLGRREDALAAAQEAVALRRTLAAQRPDAFNPDLAGSLNNLANCLSELGRREDALAAAQEAVALRRTLAAQRPDAFNPDLAMALNNLTGRLSALGRREDALAAAEEAVALRRTLAAQRPDAFNPDLAMALKNLTGRLSALGRREDALAAAEEAVTLRRTLAAQRPDAFNPDLAGSLNNLATCLSDLGRREDALAAAQEAVALRRTLAAQRPDAFNPDLAVSLAVLANCQQALGDVAMALATNAVAIRTLATPFTRHPAAFVHWMGPMVRQYLERAQSLQQEPDTALLAPVLKVLEQLGPQSTENEP